MDGETFMECWVTVAGDCLQALYKIDLLQAGRNIEGVPGELSGADMNPGVYWEEARFELPEIRFVGLSRSLNRNGTVLTSGAGGSFLNPLCATDGRMRYSQLFDIGQLCTRETNSGGHSRAEVFSPWGYE
jgi:hypothetical protein